jgi:hypothetical protein
MVQRKKWFENEWFHEIKGNVGQGEMALKALAHTDLSYNSSFLLAVQLLLPTCSMDHLLLIYALRI